MQIKHILILIITFSILGLFILLFIPKPKINKVFFSITCTIALIFSLNCAITWWGIMSEPYFNLVIRYTSWYNLEQKARVLFSDDDALFLLCVAYKEIVKNFDCFCVLKVSWSDFLLLLNSLKSYVSEFRFEVWVTTSSKANNFISLSINDLFINLYILLNFLWTLSDLKIRKFDLNDFVFFLFFTYRMVFYPLTAFL